MCFTYRALLKTCIIGHSVQMKKKARNDLSVLPKTILLINSEAQI